MAPLRLEVRLSPDGWVARRFTDGRGDPHWVLASYSTDTGITVRALTDDEVASWPRLVLPHGSTATPIVGAPVHYTPRDTGERVPACVDATVTAVDDVEGSRWVGLDVLAEGERSDLDAGVADADAPTCDGLRHAPGTWHWPASKSGLAATAQEFHGSAGRRGG